MAENLNYDASGSKCYENEPDNCQIYGRLYDWETAKTACPEGWHLPSKNEYDALVVKVAGSWAGAGVKLKSKDGGWDYGFWGSSLFDVFDDGPNGTDEFGFSALPGGHGNHRGSFYSIRSDALLWSSSERGNKAYYFRIMRGTGLGPGDKRFSLSVRCIQD